MSLPPNPSDRHNLGAEAYETEHIANVATAVRELAHPTQIGPYHILSLIGEGGMGSVYKAEQRQPIHRIVALKIIKLGMDTRQVIARFESERQALAMMNHPNVARVLDAGATDSGRPYFVMEFVSGEPITTFADRHKLTTRQRLELFTQACEAIQHAHQKAIIHRDLKPSNILVTIEDGHAALGLVKVIDFGVAKAISRPLTDKTLFTETGQMLGTPEYMSPEQAEMSGLDVDTRTDVYSLGVVLYELLTGALPFEPSSLRSAGYNEIQRIIRETDPPRPSTRLSSLGRGAEEVANRRRTELSTLERELKSELEWIPLRAMRKDRTQRYATATELADDIRNYLENRPLRAGPESAGYRLRKFLRRNRTGVVAAATMVLLLLAGITATSWQAVRATRAERKTRAALAEVELQKAQVEQANANTTAVNEFLTQDLLRSADPAVTRGQDMTVKQAVDIAAKTVASRFPDRPRIEAAVRMALALTYDAVGRADLGWPHAQWALDQRRKMLGDDHPETIQAINTAVTLLQSQGRYDEAEPLCREAIERARRVLGEDHHDTVTALSNMGHLLHARGQFAEAEAFYQQDMQITRRMYGPEHPHTLLAINNVASVLQSQGRYAEAEPLFREVLELQRRELGDDHPDTLTGMSNLAMTLMKQDKLDEAEALYRRALEAARRVLGDDHPNTLVLLRNLSGVSEKRGNLDEAETLLRQALETSQRTLTDDHEVTIGAMNNLAALLKNRGKLDEGIALYREALERYQRNMGEDHLYTILSQNNLGQALAVKGDWEGAEKLFAEVYRRIPQSQLDAKSAAICMSRWGPCLVELGRYEQAEAPLREAYQRLRATGLHHSPAMANVLGALVKLCEATGRSDEAARWRLELAATTQPATGVSGPSQQR